MSRDLTVTEAVNFLMDISKESEGWAKHYDSARQQLVTIIIAASVGGTIYMIGISDEGLRLVGLLGISISCLTITNFACLYTKLYNENFLIHKNLRQYASTILLGRRDPQKLSRTKIDKKIYEARLSALGVNLVNHVVFSEFHNKSGEANEVAYVRALEAVYDDFWGFQLERTAIACSKSTWIWICLGYSIAVPALALIFKKAVGG